MTKVKIPFLKEFKDVMLSGKKRMTSRTKKYGEVADVFDAFGSSFLILAVKKMDLRDISCFYYKDEGFDNQEEFTECWKKIHPRKGFVPTQMVWVHRFRKLNVGEELSLQKKLELRRQRHMAQRANKQWQDGYCSAIDDFQKDVRSCAKEIQELLATTLLEELADLEHTQWAGWMKYQKIAPICKREDWERLMKTPYYRLTEKEKDSDRALAKRVTKLIEKTILKLLVGSSPTSKEDSHVT